MPIEVAQFRPMLSFIVAAATWMSTDNYGWRLGRVVDPFGHHWEIGRPLDS